MGLAVGSIGWEFQFNYFGNKPEYQCLVFDNRGCGKTEVVNGRYTILDMAKDTLDLLNQMGPDWLTNVNLVGVSMGGMISLELALLKPEIFSSLVLTSTHAGRTMAPLKGTISIPRLMINRKKSPSIIAEMLFPKTYLELSAPDGFDPIYVDKKEVYTNRDFCMETSIRRQKEYPATPPKGFISQLMGTFTHYVSPARLEMLGSTGIDILVCTGDKDSLVRPSNSHHLSKKIGAELKVFKGVGHSLLNQITDEYNTLIEDHIKKAIKSRDSRIEE